MRKYIFLTLIILVISNLHLLSAEHKPLAAFKIDSLWYVIDEQGKTILDPVELKSIRAYTEGFYLVTLDYEGKEKFGFMTNTGQVAVMNFDEVRPFRMGMAVVGKDKEVAKDSIIRYFGYINNQGQMIVKPKYLEAFDFYDSLAWVMNFDERGYIDNNGNFVLMFQSHGFGNNFKQGFASFSDTSGRFGFINKQGKIAFNLQWDDAGDFVEGRAKVNKMGLYGFIDTAGHLIVKHSYDFANDFSGGYAFVGIPSESAYKSLWSLINTSGTRMFDFMYGEVRDFSEGIAAVMLNKKWKYIDPQNTQIIKGEYDIAESFHDGLAYVYSAENKINGFINPLGELILPIPDEASEIIDLRTNKKVK
ncbi:MAG TPA: WG repeat-containing protein [Candidatus Kapabacteria bacterium]|nr:WG repeat-containing protein [Candidatus Kapabacteria bacterium]